MLVLIFYLLFDFIVANFFDILAGVVVFSLIAAVIENIELFCIILGIVSLIVCSIMMYKSFDWCFDKGWIGAILSIIVHIVLTIGMGLSGKLFVSLIILIVGAVFGWRMVDDCDEGLGIFGIVISIVIPVLIMIISHS